MSTTYADAVREYGESWYYATDPVEDAPGWEINRTNRETHVDVGCNPPQTSRQTQIVQDIEIFRDDNVFFVTVDAPYEGTCHASIPVPVMVAMLRAAGYTVEPPR